MYRLFLFAKGEYIFCDYDLSLPFFLLKRLSNQTRNDSRSYMTHRPMRSQGGPFLRQSRLARVRTE